MSIFQKGLFGGSSSGGGGGSGTGWDGRVNTFADLPSAADNAGKYYMVDTATGTVGVDRKEAGIYKSNGSSWTLCGTAPLTAVVIGGIVVAAAALGVFGSSTIKVTPDAINGTMTIEGNYAAGDGLGLSENTFSLDASVDDLNDVSTTGALSGQYLGFNGSSWVPVDPSVSAFTKSGNDAYFAESGNLGIGSTAPSVKLDVNGRIAGTGYAKGQTKQRTITLPYPASAYAMNTRTFLNGNTGVAKTVSSVYVTLDSDPTTEINANLKYADACIGLANATVVNDLDTTNGVRYDDSITSASIPAGKCEYIEWDAAPDSSTAQMVLTITETNS